MNTIKHVVIIVMKILGVKKNPTVHDKQIFRTKKVI